jgi:hypothetical protein
MKKLSVSDWHRQFKDGLEDVQVDPRSRQPEIQRRDAEVVRVRSLVSSEQRLCVRLIAEGYGNLLEGKRKLWSDKWVLHHDSSPAHDV